MRKHLFPTYGRSPVIAWCGACSAVISLTGCPASGLPTSQAIDARYLASVQTEIKRQIGDYLLFAYRARMDAQKKTVCGETALDFHIDAIQAQLQTKLVSKTSANAGLKGPPVAPVSINAKADATNENRQNLVFFEYVVPDGYYANFFKEDRTSSPADISSLLIAYHDGLLTARDQYPCLTGFNFTGKEAPGANRAEIGLTFTGVLGAGGGVEAGPLTLGVSHDRTVENYNVLTIFFSHIDRGSIPEIAGEGPVRRVPFLNAETPFLFTKESAKSLGYQLCRYKNDRNYFLYWCDEDLKKINIASGTFGGNYGEKK